MDTIVIEPKHSASATVIWMHGLGSNAEDMAGLARQLPLNFSVRHIALNAPIRPVTINQFMPMPAWYDIVNLSFDSREDKAGVFLSEQSVRQVIEAQLSKGVPAETIFLAGFSQGGAMALFTALKSTYTLGGVVALSAYLPLASECQHSALPKNTPMFFGSGVHDNVVLPLWTAKTVRWLHTQGFSALTVHEYPMAHTVCVEEIQALGAWLDMQRAQLISVGDRS